MGVIAAGVPWGLLGLIVVGGVVWMVLFLAWAHRDHRLRQEAFLEAGRRLGLAYSPKFDGPIEELVGGHPFFARGDRRWIGPVWSGTLEGRSVFAGEFSYSSRKSDGATPTLPFVLVPDLAAVRTDFDLIPQNMFRALAAAVTGADINFEGSPADVEFSKRYILRGADEAAIRARFSAPVREVLSEDPDWTISAFEGRIAMSHPWRKMRSFQFTSGAPATPEEIERVVRRAIEISRLLAGPA